MNVMHRHVHVGLAKHTLPNYWVVSVVDQECRKPVSQIVEPEPRAIFGDYTRSNNGRSDVVLHDHDAEPRLRGAQFERGKHEI